MKLKPKHEKNEVSQYAVLEKHFLNTFYSGIYLAPSEIVKIAKRFDIELGFKNREVLIKQLLSDASKHNKINEVLYAISTLINERINSYKELIQNYPNTAAKLMQTVQKLKSTDLLLKRELRGNPYE